MKKQLLLLLVLVSFTKASATHDLQSYCTKENALLTFIFAGWAFLAYKLITEGVQPGGPYCEKEKEESDFMRNDYDYPFGRLSDTNYVEKPITVKPVS